ncbi:MAG: response regulator [Cellvibrionales bacterium]|nr:response regulator [Cellvibrionales bacterium]
MARILIVDDSRTETKNLSKLLSKHGHQVIAASSGEEGLTVAAKDLPDLILMDVVMPGLNGFQTTRKLTQNEATKHIPVIMVTTKNQETDKVWAMRQGAAGFLVKPVAEQDLLSAIAAALGP